MVPACNNKRFALWLNTVSGREVTALPIQDGMSSTIPCLTTSFCLILLAFSSFSSAFNKLQNVRLLAGTIAFHFKIVVIAETAALIKPKFSQSLMGCQSFFNSRFSSHLLRLLIGLDASLSVNFDISQTSLCPIKPVYIFHTGSASYTVVKLTGLAEMDVKDL